MLQTPRQNDVTEAASIRASFELNRRYVLHNSLYGEEAVSTLAHMGLGLDSSSARYTF